MGVGMLMEPVRISRLRAETVEVGKVEGRDRTGGDVSRPRMG